MKTTIYAVYLPDPNTTPAYIGSHNTEPPQHSPALQWRYANLSYLGQGMWLDPHSGQLTTPPTNQHTRWAQFVASLSPAQRLALRVVSLAVVPHSQRCPAEAHAIRTHHPTYNTLCPQTAEERRLKHNAYHRTYGKAYLARNPDKAAAKRTADRERIRARRAAAKAAAQTPLPL